MYFFLLGFNCTDEGPPRTFITVTNNAWLKVIPADAPSPLYQNSPPIPRLRKAILRDLTFILPIHFITVKQGNAPNVNVENLNGFKANFKITARGKFIELWKVTLFL